MSGETSGGVRSPGAGRQGSVRPRRAHGHSLDEPSGSDLGSSAGAASFALAGSGERGPLYSDVHREANPAGASESPSLTARTRTRRWLRLVAALLNVVLFGAGLYFEMHPRDRGDQWSAGGVAAVAVLNSAALTVPTRGRAGGHFVTRLRRIALFANTLLLAVAVLIVGLSALRDWRHALLHGAALAVPPLLTILALRRYPHG
jgi:hypothetical protein